MQSIPGLFLERAAERPAAVAFYVLDSADPFQGGEPAAEHPGWRRYTYGECREQVARIALALRNLGVQHGDRVGILGETSHLWAAADLGILSLGAVTVGLYPTMTPEQVAYQLRHAGVKVLLVDGAPQAARMRPLRESLPRLAHVYGFVAAEGVEALALPAADLKAWAAEVERVKADDLATLVYTSGTTGDPKGAMLSHANFVSVVKSSREALPTHPGDRAVVFLPLAHSLQRFALYRGLEEGVLGYYAPSIDSLPKVFPVARPQVLLTVPRMLEKIKANAEATAAAKGERVARIFQWAFEVGIQAARLRANGETPGLRLRIKQRIAERLVFSKIKAKLGGALRVLISGGAALSVEVAEWFEAMGLVVCEGWGLTETSAPATANREANRRLGTVGQALPGVRVERAVDGELLVHSPGNFQGYWQDREASAAAFERPGWFRTGDLGEIDADGFVKIVGRKKAILVTAGGKNIAPTPIEKELEGGLIGQALLVGDERPWVGALLALDPEALAARAKRGAWPGGPDVWATRAEVQAEVEARVAQVNSRLARFEQVKHWALTGPFSVESDEMTPSLKLRRNIILKRRAVEIDQLYRGK